MARWIGAHNGSPNPFECYIILGTGQLTQSEMNELVDYLLANPNAVGRVTLGPHMLTDETGLKMAQYVAASSTIKYLDLSNNHFTDKTYLALAAAMRVNTSLQTLYLGDNKVSNRIHVDAAFVQTLHLNLDQHIGCAWHLYSFSWTHDEDFWRLKRQAFELDAPSLLAQLDFVEDCRAENKIYTL